MSDSSSTPTDPRERAIASLKAKRSFKLNVAIYLVVNAFLVVLWATTSDDTGFWPIWSIVFWGIGVAVQGWHVYGPGWGQITEDQIQQEVQRQQGA